MVVSELCTSEYLPYHIDHWNGFILNWCPINGVMKIIRMLWWIDDDDMLDHWAVNHYNNQSLQLLLLPHPFIFLALFSHSSRQHISNIQTKAKQISLIN